MYETFYGLSAKPFQLNPDPSFYFGSRGHRRAMAYLEYGLHQSEGFIVITGDVGAGKTTLVRSLLQKLDPDKIVAGQLVSTQLDADDILRLVSAAFGLPNKGQEKADMLLALEMFLVSVAAKGKRVLLLVDEAQNLTPRALEELRMLSNFQIGEHSLLQSFLIGQPEFRETMRTPEMLQLRQRVLASYHLGPLDLEETRAYIEHRLTHVGWKGNPAFQQDTFQAIFDFTGGVPRRINTLCDRLLLSGFLAGKETFSAREVGEVTQEMTEEAGGEALASYHPDGMEPAPRGTMAPAVAGGGGAAGGFAAQAALLESRLVRLEREMADMRARLRAGAGELKQTTGKEDVTQ